MCTCDYGGTSRRCQIKWPFTITSLFSQTLTYLKRNLLSTFFGNTKNNFNNYLPLEHHHPSQQFSSSLHCWVFQPSHLFFVFSSLFQFCKKKKSLHYWSLIILFKLFCLNDIRLYHWRLNYTMRTKQINIPQGKKDLLFQVNCKVK